MKKTWRYSAKPDAKLRHSKNQQKVYLGGDGDLVSRFIMGINGVSIWVIGVTNPTLNPKPPKP